MNARYLNNIITSFLLLSSLLCSLSTKGKESVTIDSNQNRQQEVWITVFVHGIMSIQPHLSMETVLKVLNDRIQNSFYSYAVESIRTDPFFHRNQAMQDLGLLPIDKESSYAGDASCALAVLFDQGYATKKNLKAEQNYYYTYGWSGLLSPSIRLREAKEFYAKLAAEIQKFRDRGIEPKIRVIGYSHGGNIVLGMAQGRRDKFAQHDFTIDEVVFLGVPIQAETDHYVNDPIFKKIYHFYSLCDRIQVIDCFSFNRFGSGKIFKARKNFALPEKLVQIELRLMRNTKSNRYKTKNNDNRYNFENPAILAGRSHGLRNSSPGHCELWFFGWTHAHYRAQFPLSPLPIVAILPQILETIKEVESDFPARQHLVADLRPAQETLIVRTKKKTCQPRIFSFLTLDQLEDLKDISREFSFKRVTFADYYEAVESAFKRTREKLSSATFCPNCGKYYIK